MPCSFTRRRTTGDNNRPSAGAGGSPPAAGAGGGAGAAGCAAAGGAGAARRGGGAARAPARGGAALRAGRRRRPPRSGAAAAPARRRGGAAAGARRRLGRGRGRRGVGGGGALIADHGDHRADIDRLALGDPDLGHDAGDRRRHLGVDLVGGDLEQRLVGGDRVADLLEPLRDRALGDRLTELWERDVSHVCVWCLSDQPLKSRPVSESIVSPNSSDRLG